MFFFDSQRRQGAVAGAGSRHWVVPVLAASCLLSACSTSGDSLAGKALEFVGLKTPATAEEARALVPQQTTVALRLHAGDQLNTNERGQSISVVVRIYRLRRLDAFLSAPYAAFGEAAAEKKAFGDDLIDANEVVFRPGMKHEVVETLPKEASHLGVVALFRAPAEGRWRFAFPIPAASKTGVTVGLHGCAISVAAGQPERTPPELLRVAGVRCK